MSMPSCLSSVLEHSAQDPNALLQLIPFAIAIMLAIVLRNATVALACALISAHVVVTWSCQVREIIIEAIVGPLKDITQVLASGDLYTLIFVATMAVLANELVASGDIDQLVTWINRKRTLSKRKVGISAILLGLFVFVESSLSCMIVGLTFRPLRKEVKMSPEKFSYICDSMSSPVAMLFPINGWGAFVMSQIASVGVADPLNMLLKQMQFAYYPIGAILLCTIAVVFEWNIFGMKSAERKASTTIGRFNEARTHAHIKQHKPGAREAIDFLPSNTKQSQAISNMAIPSVPATAKVPLAFILTIVSLLFVNIALLALSGYYNLTHQLGANLATIDINLWSVMGAAEGSLAVLISVLSVFGIRALLRWVIPSSNTLTTLFAVIWKSAKEIAPIILLMVLAFAFGRVSRELLRIDEVILSYINGSVDAKYFAAVVFIAGAVLSFSTGTSWGTFAILIPIAMPLAAPMQVRPEIILAAILGGGVFGDQSSPISDTTVLSSMMSECRHGSLTIIGYLLAR